MRVALAFAKTVGVVGLVQLVQLALGADGRENAPGSVWVGSPQPGDLNSLVAGSTVRSRGVWGAKG